jgi:hypothetical protein
MALGGVGMCLAGCSGAAGVAPVKGTVSHEGQRLTGGLVVLSPIGGGKSLSADVQPDGTFVLEGGARPGQHRVAVVGPRNLESEEEQPRLSFAPPPGYAIDLKADGENELLIDMRRSNGWQVQVEK